MAGTDNGTEPRYAGEVFSRLWQANQLGRSDDGPAGMEGDFFDANYELRRDGAWLRPNRIEDYFNWTPVCDAEECSDSPDPLTTPGLKFPFTARELAAFMLDGWGGFLRDQYAREDGQLDVDAVHEVLGNVRDAKPREAIARAFAALEHARRHVGEPDVCLAEAEKAAAAARDEAIQEAERLSTWREVGISEVERRSRAKRHEEMMAAAEAALRNAKRAREENYVAWRKDMVRWLLGAERGKPSTRPVPRAQAHEAAILSMFSQLGLDPMKLPRPRLGTASVPVASVRAALGPVFTSDVMQKAMARLFKDGRAAYIDTPAG